jgi:hypothetical protein
MSDLEVHRYTPDRASAWNEFVSKSRNGTFLFNRGYMDYHADRFNDSSLIVSDGSGIVALLPAHERQGELVSHGGLSYGGFVTGPRMTIRSMEACFDALIAYMKEQGHTRLIYKAVPSIYHRMPAQEDLHVLFMRDASMYRRDILMVIDREERGPVQERRRRGLKKAVRNGLTVRDSNDYAAYWDVLTENLRSKHEVDPVHSLEEITLLASRFPENMRLTACYDGERLVAGVVVYVSDRVAHLQYIASSEPGRERGALDLLMDHLIATSKSKRYFDFGAVTEQDGRYVNAGLAEFKEGFGASTVVHDFYRLEI